MINSKIMKKLTLILVLSIPAACFSQVVIGQKESEEVTNASVSLEFGDHKYGAAGRGLILPWVNSAQSLGDAVPGTVIFDSADKLPKYRKGSSWFPLSKTEIATVDGAAKNTEGKVNRDLQNQAEQPSAKVSIGNATDAKGILVLEDDNKAMILPKVPMAHNNIVNPEPGTMVYDPVYKHLAVFNGTVWSFWSVK